MIAPLSMFSAAERERIELLASQPTPPPKWIYFGDPDDLRPVACIMSRAYYEWHLRRGRDIRNPVERERIGAGLRATVIARDGLTCGICKERVEHDDVHLDHVRPVSRGGPNTAANLRVTHSRCNMRKGARWEPPR